MPQSTKERNHNDPAAQVTFARDLGLFDATMLGVGAMIGAGIFVLTGIAAGEAGPASLLAFALNALVTLLTAFAYAELASALPRAGGGYSFVRMAFPGAAGFVSGWILWFAYTVACSLYALGFAGYFWELFQQYLPWLVDSVDNLIGRYRAVLVITFLVGSGFTWLNVRGAEVTGKTENALTLSKITVLCIFLAFGLYAIFHQPERVTDSLTPFFPRGLGGVLIAMGLTFIAFEGYDLIATVAEEVKNPQKNIPRATFLSLAVTVPIYLLILFVSLAAIDSGDQPAWQFLGKFKETAIVRAAESFMPTAGVAVIVFGGLLSTTSALNATVMAASRVAFSMGRDLWLPSTVSKIHVRRRTPHVAILTTGAILIGMALTLPLEAVGSAASLIFLLTFALVNLAVIVLRRKHPEIPRKYKVPFYPIIPVLGFALNILLALYQFRFQPVAWYVTLGWIGAGLLLYYAVFEKKSAVLKPQVLIPEPAQPSETPEPCVMVALNNPANIEALLELSYPIACSRGLRMAAVSIVEVPRQVPIHEGMRTAHHREALLARAKKIAARREEQLDTKIVVAHRVADGILSAVERHKADVLVMGWKGFTNTRDRLFGEVADQVIRHLPCDLVLIKKPATKELKTCLLPTSGGPNARLAASIIGSIAAEKEMSITAGHIVSPRATPEQIETANRHLDDTVSLLGKSAENTKKMLIQSKSVSGGIARAGKEYDLVVIGAAKEPFFRKMLFGEIPEKVARYSPSTVMLVKKYEGAARSLLKRILG
ncbi:MAG: amino acid permease [Candidatus Zixiibacteriota bacterium]|nr:MAG: amino acid permease [candidate division Zixibacteria bacterium]